MAPAGQERTGLAASGAVHCAVHTSEDRLVVVMMMMTMMILPQGFNVPETWTGNQTAGLRKTGRKKI